MDRLLAPPIRPASEALCRWKQGGTVSLWRYAQPRRFQGWHVTVDAEGGHALLALIDLLLDANDASLYRSLIVSRATAPVPCVPNCRSTRAVSPARSRLRLSSAHDDWCFTEGGGRLELSLGETWMRTMRDAVESVLRGERDFCIGPRRRDNSSRHPMWFWWWPRSAG